MQNKYERGEVIGQLRILGAKGHECCFKAANFIAEYDVLNEIRENQRATQKFVVMNCQQCGKKLKCVNCRGKKSK